MAPANLGEPGWSLRHGQAVWQPPGNRPEIAGELLFATRPDGARFLEFSKPPFPIVRVQETTNQWQMVCAPRNRNFRGNRRGSFPNPSVPVIWLHLARLLGGEPPPVGWTWQTNGAGWRIGHPSGTAVEGYLQP